MRGITLAQSNLVRADHNVTNLVDSPTTGAAKHLENLVWAQRMFDVISSIRFSGQSDAPQRKINPRCQTHRCNNNSELAGFGQWLDHPSASGVAQSAMMISDSVLEHFRKVLADQLLLVEPKRERIWCGQVTSELRRQ